MKTFMTILLTLTQIVSCGPNREEASSAKQAAVACAFLAPAPPVAASCAVSVTAAQWIVTVIVGGAVVGTAAVATSSRAKVATVGGYQVRLTPTPVPAPHPIATLAPKVTPCPPCNGRLPAPMFHKVPPSRKHWPCPGDHTHFFKWNQDRATCKCFAAKVEPPICH